MLYLYMENSDEEYFTPDEITQEELIEFIILYKKKFIYIMKININKFFFRYVPSQSGTKMSHKTHPSNYL